MVLNFGPNPNLPELDRSLVWGSGLGLNWTVSPVPGSGWARTWQNRSELGPNPEPKATKGQRNTSLDMMVVCLISDFFWQSFPPAKSIQAGLAILLDVCAALQIICRYPCDIEVDQVAKGVTSSWDALIELLESIEHFLSRLDIYTRIPRTPAMDEIVLKIIVELLSTLALATRELKQGRSSEPILADVSPYSPQYSQICEEGFRREGLRSGPAEARPTHTR